MNRTFVAVMGIACLLSLPAGFYAGAQANGQVWEFPGGQLMVGGPGGLTIVDARGARKEIDLDGDLAVRISLAPFRPPANTRCWPIIWRSL